MEGEEEQGLEAGDGVVAQAQEEGPALQYGVPLYTLVDKFIHKICSRRGLCPMAAVLGGAVLDGVARAASL